MVEVGEKIVVIRKNPHIHCGECGVWLKWTAPTERNVCRYCGKKLCEKCVAHEIVTGGVCCKPCFDIYRKYKPAIDEAYDTYLGVTALMLRECKVNRRVGATGSIKDHL